MSLKKKLLIGIGSIALVGAPLSVPRVAATTATAAIAMPPMPMRIRLIGSCFERDMVRSLDVRDEGVESGAAAAVTVRAPRKAWALGRPRRRPARA